MRSEAALIAAVSVFSATMIWSPAIAVGQVCGPAELTQNIDTTTIVDGRGIACEDGGGVTFESRYARSYDLSACPLADTDFAVTCVMFAVEFNTVAGYEVTINVYQDTDGGAPESSLDDLVLLGSTTAIVPEIPDPDPKDGEDSPFIIADFTAGGGSVAYVPANAQMVVELVLPTRDVLSGGDGGSMRPGFNDLGETAEAYFKSLDCSVPQYETFSNLFFPNNHFIQVVYGEPALIVEPCPANCAGGDDQVDVTDLLNLLAGWGQAGQACDIAGDDDTIDVTDLLQMLASWGPCEVQTPFCVGDTDFSGNVDVADLLTLLSEWGVVDCTSPADFNFSGEVDVTDLLELLAAWGPCP